jgi:transposase InsO family protein
MENILQGLPHVCIYIDDILVTGSTTDEHLHNLEEVLTRLENANARLKRKKCEFMLPSVEYLGHRISAKGLQPTDAKVQAIRNAPSPRNVSQLKSFLGLLNYYCKFLPNLSSTLAPLYKLLHKNTAWCWTTEQQQAFQHAKDSLTSDCLLVHYDPTKELILACDASPYGVGAVLSHKTKDGQEKPIAFASRSLAPAEKKYSQLDKEALAIIFGVKRFHQYLFGRHFTILSDHKPLQHLFHPDKATPPLASARIQRWALTLGAYDYQIVYKSGPEHGNADMLSRLPLPESPTEVPVPGETIMLMDMLNSYPVTSQQIKIWTDHDPVFSRVRDSVLKGWQDSTDENLKPYQQRKLELSVHDGCLLWGNRVIVPPAGRARIKEELHSGHPGASRMKSLARSFVWWPRMDQELEETVKQCDVCQRSRHHPPVASLQPWEWPQRPWVRLHADYAGPFLGKMFLILVDAHSKWMEVKSVSAATSTQTIEHLRTIFATHGLPEMLVTDNGSVFTSSEFKNFTKRNGIRHVTSAPYHPASNGLAERAVQTFKEHILRTKDGSLDARISRFLFQYRTTPHTTTGVSPAELLLGRRPRTLLDLLVPKVSDRVQHKQEQQKSSHDKRARVRKFQVNDLVYARKFPNAKEWIPGKIVKVLGPLSFEVELELDHSIIRRHIDHIKSRQTTMSVKPSVSQQSDDWTYLPDLTPTEHSPDPEPPPSTLRRSSRITQPPDRFGYT